MLHFLKISRCLFCSGFGYIEFSNAASATEAISGMNMFDLGGQYLRVGKCITPPDALTYIVPTSAINLPTAAAVAAAEVTAKIQAEEMTAAAKSPLHQSPSIPKVCFLHWSLLLSYILAFLF